MGNVPSNETGPALLFDEKQIANVFYTQFLTIDIALFLHYIRSMDTFDTITTP